MCTDHVIAYTMIAKLTSPWNDPFAAHAPNVDRQTLSNTGIFTGNKDMMNVFQLVLLFSKYHHKLRQVHKSMRNGQLCHPYPFMA